MSNAIGGVRVQIAESDVEAAREFLMEDTLQSPSDALDAACPSCGSTDIAVDESQRQLALFGLVFLHLPLCVPWRRYRCAGCNGVFRTTAERRTDHQ